MLLLLYITNTKKEQIRDVCFKFDARKINSNYKLSIVCDQTFYFDIDFTLCFLTYLCYQFTVQKNLLIISELTSLAL